MRPRATSATPGYSFRSPRISHIGIFFLETGIRVVKEKTAFFRDKKKKKKKQNHKNTTYVQNIEVNGQT